MSGEKTSSNYSSKSGSSDEKTNLAAYSFDALRKVPSLKHNITLRTGIGGDRNMYKVL